MPSPGNLSEIVAIPGSLNGTVDVEAVNRFWGAEVNLRRNFIDGCRYRFVHSGLAWRDVDDEEGLAAGWHLFFDRLDLFLGGAPIDLPVMGARWEELKPVYRARLDAIA